MQRDLEDATAKLQTFQESNLKTHEDRCVTSVSLFTTKCMFELKNDRDEEELDMCVLDNEKSTNHVTPHVQDLRRSKYY